MPHNHSSHSGGSLLLMVGLGLCAVVILDLQQTTVQAYGTGASGAISSPLQMAGDRPTIPDVPSQMPSEQELTLSQAQTYAAQPGQPGSDSLAVNSEELGTGIQPNVSNVDPNETAFRQWQGASFPVEQFQTYTSPFGFRMSPTGGYTQEFHYGLDLAAPEGSYIRSWWSGTVVEVSDDSNCGTSVVIESGRWLHIYCHMQGYVDSDSSGRYMIDRNGGIQIWEGQQVSAGQRLGRVGMTGRTTGPHLHWGLKYDGSWVDPAFVLRAMYASQQTASNPPTGYTQY
jgi:murein DD-endopeptidase MepM/ murein hydrolase activator NlpD